MRLAVFIPQKDFKDESLNLIRLILDKWGVKYSIAAYGKGGIGTHGAVVHADVNPAEVTTDQFDGLVFIDGKGIDDLKMYDYRPLLEVVQRFNDSGKYILGIGNAVKIAARANIVKAKKVVVPDEDSMRLVRLFYGVPSNNDIEIMSNLITIKNSKAVESNIDQWLSHMRIM